MLFVIRQFVCLISKSVYFDIMILKNIDKFVGTLHKDKNNKVIQNCHIIV